MASNDTWLAQVEEEALDPELPIIDTHHHLWDHRKGRVDRRYLMDELQCDLQTGHNIVATVFIECTAMYWAEGPELLKPVGEVEFVNGIAAMAASGLYGAIQVAAGIMGFAELQQGSRVKETLEAQMAAAPDRFRGIRRTGAWDPDPRITRAKLPGMFLNHLGGIAGIGAYQGRQDEIFVEWSQSIAALAECPNIVMKLGGINMDYSGFGWHENPKPPSSEVLCQVTRRYYETTIAEFGVDRCMFESNFPVDKISCSYQVLWNAFKRITANYSDHERGKLFHDNAKRVYRL